MSLSIRWRLALWIAIALVVTLVAVFITLRLTLTRILSDDLDSQLSADAGKVAAQVVLAGSQNSGDLQPIVQGASFVTVIRDANGQPLVATPGLDPRPLVLDAQTLQRVLAGEVSEQSVTIDGQDTRVRTSRLLVGRQVLGVVQVGESAETIASVQEALQWTLLAVGAIGAVFSLVLGYVLARGALKPIDAVADVAREIEASDLSRRLAVKGKPAEVQRLADTFDVMLDRLSAAFLQQRNFVMDVSHELRTPLTALRGGLDVMLMSEDLDADTREQLQRMSQEVSRLIRLTSNLLYLAHADAGRGLVQRPVELDDLCVEVARQAKDLRPEVRFRLKHEDSVTVMGDRDLLKQLILNLVDNGLKYTPAGGEVTLSLQRDGGWAQVSVTDSGPGISAQEIPHIFERYYRGEGSGARSGSGAGIGLAISQWVAVSHGGRIDVESEVGKGSTFTVRLPAGPRLVHRQGAEKRIPIPPPPRPTPEKK